MSCKIISLKGNNSISQDRVIINENFNNLNLCIESIQTILDSGAVDTTSSSVANTSSVTGNNVTQALDTLQTAVTALEGATGPTAFSMTTEALIVDAVQGSDATGAKGSFETAYETIAGAEADAVAGDVIRIITDVNEAGMGKDGVIYVIDKGCKVYYEASQASPGSATSGHLWTDSKGATAISFVVYGGIHEGEGDWFGNSDRGIIYNQNGSDIRIYGAEKIFAKGTSQDFIVSGGTGGNTEIHCNGDVISGLNGVQLNSVDSRVVITAKGKLQTELRAIASYSGGRNYCLLKSDTEFINLGHSISGLRSTLYPANSTAGRSHWIVESPLITIFDPYPNLGSNNGAVIFGWNDADHLIEFKGNLLKLYHDDTVTYTNEMGLLGLNRTSVNNTNYEVVFDVRKIILGKGHELDDTYSSIDRANALVKWINTEIVTLTDVVESGNVIDCENVQHSFEGTNKLILNPTAISAGQSALGGTGTNEAYIAGTLISNGDFLNASTFTDLLSGATGTNIGGLYMNDASGLIDFTKYNDYL